MRSKRVDKLHANGVDEAYLYGVDASNQPGTEGLNAFFLLVDKPELYNLPPDPLRANEEGRRLVESNGMGSVRCCASGVRRGDGRGWYTGKRNPPMKELQNGLRNILGNDPYEQWTQYRYHTRHTVRRGFGAARPLHDGTLPRDGTVCLPHSPFRAARITDPATPLTMTAR